MEFGYSPNYYDSLTTKITPISDICSMLLSRKISSFKALELSRILIEYGLNFGQMDKTSREFFFNEFSKILPNDQYKISLKQELSQLYEVSINLETLKKIPHSTTPLEKKPKTRI